MSSSSAAEKTSNDGLGSDGGVQVGNAGSELPSSNLVSEDRPKSSEEVTQHPQAYDETSGVTTRRNSKFSAANRNSLRQFTQRFRSFSNDLLRSIESAHDMVDLGNSNFATATQLAAAQHFLAPFYLGSPPSTSSTSLGGVEPGLSASTPTTPGYDLNLNELGLDELPEVDENDDADVFEKSRDENDEVEDKQTDDPTGQSSQKPVVTSLPKSPTMPPPSTLSFRPVRDYSYCS